MQGIDARHLDRQASVAALHHDTPTGPSHRWYNPRGEDKDQRWHGTDGAQPQC